MARLDPSVPLTFVYGDSAYMIERAVTELVDAILPAGSREYSLTSVDFAASPVEEASAPLQMGSLIAETRVVLLRNLHELKADDQKQIAGWLGSMAPGLYVIVTADVSRRVAEKSAIPARKALAEAIEARGQWAAFITPYERELAGWVSDEFRRMGKAIDRRAADLLVEMVGRDQAQLVAEAQKLATYVGEAPAITEDDVRQVAVRSAEATVFQLVDAIAEGDVHQALSVLPDLVPAHGAMSSAIPLLGMIARNLRLLWQASFLAANGAPVDRRRGPRPELDDLLPEEHNVVTAARASFVAGKLARHARNFNDDLAAASFERVLHADQTLKGQTDEYIDPRLVVERLVIELCLLSQRFRGTGRRH